MIPSGYESLSEEFQIVEALDSPYPGKKFRTYLAYPDTTAPMSLTLKEIDAKRAKVYQAFLGKYHPGIATVYEVREFHDVCRVDGPTHLAVTEFIYGPSLYEYLLEHGPLCKEEALCYASQIADGLIFMHKQGFIHKDIKPDNIILAKGKDGTYVAKIIDFGISESYDHKKSYATEVGGTMGYRAPEVNDFVATPRSDVFSLGSVLNFMLCGQDPTYQIYNGDKEVEKIIEKATNLEASYRYASMKEFKKQLLHAKRAYVLDRIPLLRSIPGYRSHTFFKEVLASVYYAYILFVAVSMFMDRRPLKGLCFFIVYIPLLWVSVFDVANLSRLFPRWIRQNNLLKREFMIITIFIFVVVLYLLGLGIFMPEYLKI